MRFLICDFPVRRAGKIILAVMLLWAPAALGADEWILTTAEFRTERVGVRGINEDGISIVGADGAGRVVGFDRMLQLDRINPAHITGGRFMLVLAGGEQLAGEPRGLEGETLIWVNPALGELRFPLSSALSISRTARPPPAPQKRAPDDVITLVNGDTLRGIIASVSAGSVSMQASGGESMEVPLNSVASIEFAPTSEPQNPAHTSERGFRISLNDHSTIVARSVRTGRQQLELTLADGSARSLPLAAVTVLEQVNGPVVWLSSRHPIENVQTPFLESSWPARMNQSVRGGDIRFGERGFSRGIGVHSYSRLVWSIDGGYKAFRTQYAMDGQLPYANVTVRIKLDDTVVHEQRDFRAGSLSPLVVLDTADARTITLEVDYGDSYDVQDRFNWIEPALLKSRPQPPAPSSRDIPTQPATVPAGGNP